MHDLADVLEELKRREPIFHRREFGTTRADFERLMVDDYWEIGASGQRYDRAFILDELERRYAGEYPDEWQTSDFEIRQLAENVFLLTYTLLQGNTRRTRRATLWMRTAEQWKILYHQGTIVAAL
jgi:hypothetical protein